jgi:DNA-binding LacI/PurR family transcriptional regulator
MSLHKSLRNVIGIATPEPGRGRFDYWFGQAVWQGLTDAGEEFGQDLLFVSRPSPDRMLRDGSGLLSIPVDGFIIVAPQMDAPALQLLHERGIPFATVAGQTDLAYPTFGSDNELGVRQALSFLRQLGHTRIAHICGPLNTVDGAVRERAFREFMAEHNMEVPEEYVQKGGFVMNGGYAAGQTLLRLPERPTAIFCGNDSMAYGAIAAAQEMKLGVPEAISVIGFDDETYTALYRPPLTTVRQPAKELARAAMEAVVRIVRGATDVESRKLPTELVVRDSTAPPPRN